MNYAPDYYGKATLILGVGNTLFGDDGFGPAVADYLNKHHPAAADVAILDTGSGVRKILFNIVLAEKKPSRIVIIDAMECGREPGEVFTVSIENIPHPKTHDFSVHMLPTLNILKELRDLCHVEVVVVAAQPEGLPKMVQRGLSPKMEAAVLKAAGYIAENYL